MCKMRVQKYLPMDKLREERSNYWFKRKLEATKKGIVHGTE